jgi:hypothetical protein
MEWPLWSLAHGTFFHRVKGTKITFQHYIQKVHTKIQQLPLLTHQLFASSNCRFQDSKAELDLSKIYFSFTLFGTCATKPARGRTASLQMLFTSSDCRFPCWSRHWFVQTYFSLLLLLLFLMKQILPRLLRPTTINQKNSEAQSLQTHSRISNQNSSLNFSRSSLYNEFLNLDVIASEAQSQVVCMYIQKYRT